MWKSMVGHDVSVKACEVDDWETDPDFENDVSEQEQRWGAKTIEGSGRKEHISVAELRNKVTKEHEQVKQKEQTPKASYGYGGKFGVEKDRMDKVALSHSYVAQVEHHSSQKDASKGFGGKFGVQTDRVDKSALGFEYKGEVTQHGSQKDYSKGFGGKYGVEKEKVDKVALGYDYQAETEKHQSQKDYSAGFGGRYGVQTDRMDKSAAGFSDIDSPSSAYEKTQPLEASSAGAGRLKARFENLAKASDEENQRRAEEERERRRAREQREREDQRRQREQESHTTAAPDVTPEMDEGPTESDQHTLEEPEEPEPHVEATEDEEPPALPPRASVFLTHDVPPVPETPEEDEGEYEEVPEPPVPPSQPTGNDYADLTCGLRAAALYDYQGEADDEISFNPDDIITNVEMIDEGWWRGSCRGRVGLFPAAYVELLQ